MMKLVLDFKYQTGIKSYKFEIKPNVINKG